MKKNHKILIVEETPNARDNKGEYTELLEHFLIAKGYDVDIEYNGKSVLEKVIHEQPDIIFLGIKLWNSNGFDLLRELKKIKNIKDIPMIMFTRKRKIKYLEDAFNIGASDYLDKSGNFFNKLYSINNKLNNYFENLSYNQCNSYN